LFSVYYQDEISRVIFTSLDLYLTINLPENTFQTLFMKWLPAFLFLASVSSQVCAQHTVFLRASDLNGKKLVKGHFLMATDTSLQVKTGGGDTVTVVINRIGTIKTMRSAGRNVLVGSLTGIGVGAVLGALSADPDASIVPYTAGEGALAGAVAGLPVGAIIGAITILFKKKSKVFLINGRKEGWKKAQSYLSGRR
jgi:hypothetical protein